MTGTPTSRPRRRSRRMPTLAAALATTLVTLAAGCAPTPAQQKFARPFSPFSIWNFPIGPDATLVPSGIGVPAEIHGDVAYVVQIKPSDPVRQVYVNAQNWSGGRCTPSQPADMTVRVPDNLFIRDAEGRDTPNHPLVLVQPDGTLIEFAAAARCLHDAAGRQPNEAGYTGAVDFNLYGVPAYLPRGEEKIDGGGEQGGHGASGVSALGGIIRPGELFGSEPIRHALAVNLWAAKLLYYGADRAGYRWPAWRADEYAPGTYGGANPALVMGSLLTIPKSVTPESLGIVTPVGRKIFKALQDYGGYVVEDSFYDDVDFGIDAWAAWEYRLRTGNDFGLDASGTEIRRAMSATMIVDNNAPGNVGGGGQFRVLAAFFAALRAHAGR